MIILSQDEDVRLSDCHVCHTPLWCTRRVLNLCWVECRPVAVILVFSKLNDVEHILMSRSQCRVINTGEL